MDNYPILDHKYIIQSWIFTTARYNYTVYEKRILYRLIEYAQAEISGLKIKDHIERVHHNLKDVSISMPIASVLVAGIDTDCNKNYAAVKKACRALGKKYLEWEDLEKQEYWGDNIIYNINIKKREGIMHFSIANWVWDAIFDFSKGFRKFDIAIAMKFRSTYTMRFFEIISGQQSPLELTVSELRQMFFLENKYKHTNDFQKRVIDSSKDELDRVSPYSFEAIANYKGSKIVSYTFYPISISANQDEKLVQMEQMAKVTARLQLNQQIYEYLKFSFGFKTNEINKNKKTLVEGQKKIVNFIDFLASLRANANRANNPKGYVISAIKRTLASTEGIKGAKCQGSNYANSDYAIKDRVYQLITKYKV